VISEISKKIAIFMFVAEIIENCIDHLRKIKPKLTFKLGR